MPVVGTGIDTVWPLSTLPVSVVGVGARFVPAGSTVTVTAPLSYSEGLRSRETE
ncbi:hypothetical protein HER21_47560 [Pseudomonas sp. BGM005]|nr:hypothetical protein [Pseudomonas sp. BG5]